MDLGPRREWGGKKHDEKGKVGSLSYGEKGGISHRGRKKREKNSGIKLQMQSFAIRKGIGEGERGK